MGQIANCQYVCNAINNKLGTNLQPVSGTGSQPANCEYFLKMYDKATGVTTYGTGSYATGQLIDKNAIDSFLSRPLLYVAVGASGGIAYSTDGVNWTQTTVGTSNWYCVTYGNGKFVAGGVGGRIAYSTDGVNWTQTTAGTSVGLNGVTYGSGKFVVVGNSVSVSNSGKIAYSTDGVNWTQTTVASGNWEGVTYGNGKFVAVGTDGGIAYSTDGVNWTQTTAGSADWQGATFGGY